MPDVPSRVIDLLETFERNIDTYRSQQYNETQLRREFIDPFFHELGWDVANKAGHAHAYKDVIHEDAIKIGGATKAPDYSFRIGGTRKFFLEAKKPSVNIKGDPHPAYQLRRYAWSAKLPLSILTDFEEFAVYDCLSRPKQTDRASTARIMYLTYNEYLDNWSKIADIFSKNAILKGSFDKFAASAKGKRGTTTVDTEFLAEIEKWRDTLAKIIALRNASLSSSEINFAVQRIIDRILFLRMCEDRGIEQYGQLQAISSGDHTYPRLCDLFEKADHKYNSGLFHFEADPGRATPPDKLTPNITIDDHNLKWILHNLYYPQCPYEFSVLSAEILGNVYEQFLGKVITLTRTHQAKIEEKPQVKKAGGVYYTPSYIVDYIVKNTVAKLLNDPVATQPHLAPTPAVGGPPKPNRNPLTPKQIEKIKILDPACGSGSFLLGAYTYLLDYHRDWYAANNPEKWTKKKDPPIYQVGVKGHCEESLGDDEAISNYRLTVTEKKRILLNNIFGVDIDSQAVEVTKLSLLLKVLEDENAQSLENQHRLFHERALPDLAENIKCGNSLIAPDFFDNPDHLAPPPVGGALDPPCHSRESGNPQDLYKKINPFDWKQEFPRIFNRKNPGFDAVIGNPPYVSYYSKKALPLGEAERAYYKTNFAFHNFMTGKSLNTVMLFLEKATHLLSQNALASFIIDIGFHEKVYRPIRQYLSQFRIVELVSDIRAFPGVKSGQVIVLIQRAEKDKSIRVKRGLDKEACSMSYEDFASPTLVLRDSSRLDRVFVLLEHCPRLREFVDITCGLEYGALRDLFRSNTRKNKRYHRVVNGAKGIPARYELCWDGKYVLFDKRFEAELISRKRNYSRSGKYVHLISGNEAKYREPKILIRQSAMTLICTYDDENYYALRSLFCLNRTIPSVDLKYICGLLNSRLLSKFARRQGIIRHQKGKQPQIRVADLERLPLPRVEATNPVQRATTDKLVAFVDRMLALHKQLSAAKIPDEKTKIQRQITATDKKIDNLVYTLYNLTQEEIKIVEESSNG